MGGGEGVKGNLKNEDAEQVGSLEPDPRYIRCCSAVCRPGHALRDALLGLLVLLALAVVVTVIFVVCFYVVPDEKRLLEEGFLAGNAEGVVRGPSEGNEIFLNPSDKYFLNSQSFGEDSGSTNSQDFSTFASSDQYQETTDDVNDKLVDATIAEVTEVKNPVLEAGYLEPRENIVNNLPNYETESNDARIHHRGDNHSPARHNIGHRGERPTLPGEEHKHGHFHRTQEESQQRTCKSVQLPMCKSSVPWTESGSPNILNHTSEGEIFASLPYIRSALLDSGCSALAPLYACSVLEPPCHNNMILPPCRAFCNEVSRACSNFAHGVGLSGMFDCEMFPDSSDPSICISAKQDGVPVVDHGMETNESQIYIQLNEEGENYSDLNLPYANDVLARENTNDIVNHDIIESETSAHVNADTEESVELAICTLDMFMCLDGSDCITNGLVCDGIQNCADNSDEGNCSTKVDESRTVHPVLELSHTSRDELLVPSESTSDKLSSQRLLISSTAPNTGINTPSSDKSVSDAISTEVPTDMVSTNTVFTVSADSSMDFLPTTMMSLADRLKLAMSSNSRTKPTNNVVRHSKTHSQTPSTIIKQENTVPSFGISLADRFNIGTTERIRSFQRKRQFVGPHSTLSPPTGKSITNSAIIEADVSSGPSSSSGVMSLAELLALSNKVKAATKPSNRASTTRKRPTGTRNRFMDQISEASTGTTQRMGVSSPQLRFRGSAKDNHQHFDVEGDERRIPVRRVDELPKIKFNFPMRNPTKEPVTFRTTVNPELTSAEVPMQITTPSVIEIEKNTIVQFIPSTTTEMEPKSAAIQSTTPHIIADVPSTESCPELQCIDGTCIAISQLNDGIVDCSDGSDEQDFGGLIT